MIVLTVLTTNQLAIVIAMTRETMLSSVWVIGPTGSGKSTLAERLSSETGLLVLEAGSFCREMCDPRATYEVLARTAATVLRDDHRYFARRIRKAIPKTGAIIVGVRNPVDFISSFNPKKDCALFLLGGPNAQLGFESCGLHAISSILTFFSEMRIIDCWQSQVLVPRAGEKDWYATFHIEL